LSDEVVIVDRVQVDVEDLSKFENYAAIPVAEPMVVVYLHEPTKEHHTRAVHGFTADGHALVLSRNSYRLVRAFAATGPAKSASVSVRRTGRMSRARGPFTPAPPGMVAVFTDGSRTSCTTTSTAGPSSSTTKIRSPAGCSWPRTPTTCTASKARPTTLARRAWTPFRSDDGVVAAGRYRPA
jgi:hypothetical protein